MNTHGKSRYSKFVKIRTLNELEFVDLRVYKMSERVAVVKVKRKSIKQAIKFSWKATGLAEVRHFKILLSTGWFQILFSKKHVLQILFPPEYVLKPTKNSVK